MKVTPRSQEEARRVSSRELIKPGWRTSTIEEATETLSRGGNPMIALRHLVQLPDGSEQELLDWLLNVPALAAKFRAAVVAVDALNQYEQGEVTPEAFGGRTVSILVGIEKRGRGQPDRNYVVSYRPMSSVVSIRSAG